MVFFAFVIVFAKSDDAAFHHTWAGTESPSKSVVKVFPVFIVKDPGVIEFVATGMVALPSVITCNIPRVVESNIKSPSGQLKTLEPVFDTKIPAIVDVLTHWVLFIPACYLLGITLGFGFWGPWVAFGLHLTFFAAFIFWRFRKGYWKEIKV